MHRLGLAIGVLCWLLGPAAWAAASPAGDWLTADGNGVIRIAPCGDGYCGAIVGMRYPQAGPVPQDWQQHSQCGLTIVQTTAQAAGANGTVWQGVVLDPRNGVSHPALLSYDASGNLVLRGYLLIPLLGESTTWTAYRGGKILAQCHLPN